MIWKHSALIMRCAVVLNKEMLWLHVTVLRNSCRNDPEFYFSRDDIALTCKPVHF